MADKDIQSAPTVMQWIEYSAIRFVQFWVKLAPRSWAMCIGRFWGGIAYYLLGKRRRVALTNVGIAFPELSEAERKRIARESFSAFGQTVVENFRIEEMGRKPEKYYKFQEDEIDRLKEVFSEGKGLVIVYFHFANWELLPPAWSYKKLPQVSAVARHIKNPLMTEFLTRSRTQDNVKILFRGHAGRDILRAVKNNEGVGIPCDINTTVSDGIFVDFFGKKAATTPAPAEISLRYGAPIVIAFLERKSSGGYVARFGPILRSDDFKNQDDSVLKMMTAVNHEIENVIRRAPGQYLWGHRRWNTRPPGDDWHPYK